MQKLLEKLNERQKEAVHITEGPLLIIAGAGSGKTLVLTHKIAYLIVEKKVSPEHILAVTFTNKAAREMKERVTHILREYGHDADAAMLSLGTFHSLCLNILRTHADKLGYARNFVIFDEKDQLGLIKAACEAYKIDSERFAPEVLAGAISKLKSRLIAPSDPDQDIGDPFLQMTHRVYGHYQRALKAHNAIDFDDMIMQAIELFERHGAVRAHYQNAFRYLLIDEYQDTNFAQYRFVRLLGDTHQNICAVGDMDQAIYGWRQADIANILNFEKDYPRTKIILLEENYRSTGNILSAANTIIGKNKLRKEKNLFTRSGEGGKIHVVMTDSETEEANFIARTIKEFVKTRAYPFSHFAVLYRTNAQSRAIEEAFMHARIPYVVLGGFKFYERREVKDALSYLRFIINPKDSASLKRIVSVPPRGIGKVALERFFATGAPTKQMGEFLALMESFRHDIKNLPLSRFVKHVVKKSGLEEYFMRAGEEGVTRWENVLELVSAAAHYDGIPAKEAITRLLDGVALASREDEEHAQNAARLMTIHSAKGLEFTAVFVAGMEDNVFPHSRSKRSPEELEEERRLCYVAITRAKKNLWLLYAQSRRLYGQLQTNPPSRFLFDIPEHLVAFFARGKELSIDLKDLESGIIDIE
ncbi:UvrD-helicase domain-containing protein [Candidatus Azambacteria bacterium]|nr:UvrD-helicase domain-containing protein [Candidatus Azambacteria bacterium]